ncbi:MAG: hypothetical protein JNL11_02345 [Bdellovibrionaceae bacterium]|nr:hypothetical protein [Pseudobdellovibrionaceae bacterium]
MVGKFLNFILFAGLIFSHFSNAEEQGRQYPSLRVSDPWSFEVLYKEITKVYGLQNVSQKQLTRNQGLFEFLYVPPFNLLSLAYFKLVGRDSDEISNKAVKLCSGQNGIEGKISCLSYTISDYVDGLPRHRNGVTFDYRTFCAIAANLFFKAFNSLEIRGARAGFIEGSWMFPRSLHVVSSVFISSSEGLVYSYVMDVGNLPGVLFPLSVPAIRWHTVDGKKDSKTIKTEFSDAKLFQL